MNKGECTHMGKHGSGSSPGKEFIHSGVDRKIAQDKQKRIEHLGEIQDPNLEARELAEEMVGQINDKGIREAKKDEPLAAEFYEMPPPNL